MERVRLHRSLTRTLPCRVDPDLRTRSHAGSTKRLNEVVNQTLPMEDGLQIYAFAAPLAWVGQGVLPLHLRETYSVTPFLLRPRAKDHTLTVGYVYLFQGLFFSEDDVGMYGPFDNFIEAAQAVGLLGVNEATTSIWVDTEYRAEAESALDPFDGLSKEQASAIFHSG